LTLQLHEVIQAAFGWTDSHLHQFIIGGLVYGAPEFDTDSLSERTIFEATEVRLRDFDFHHVPNPISSTSTTSETVGSTSLKSTPSSRTNPASNIPSVPTAPTIGRLKMSAAVSGYAAFLEAWHDPEHEEHAANRQWAGHAFNPEKFDIPATNKAIASALRKAKGGYRFRQER
jgi:hypothetical protein